MRARLLALLLVCGMGLAVAVYAWRPWDSTTGTADEQGPSTATVERTSLTARTVLNAQLGYGATRDLLGAGGLVTAVPRAGRIIKAGQRVYEADGKPVFLMKGKRPLWRVIGAGAEDGPDVEQLEHDLIAAGHGLGVVEDQHLTGATVRAIRSWQKAQGLPVTGTIGPKDVIMVPARAIRVAEVRAQPGTPAEGTVLTWTSTELAATANLTDEQAAQLKAGTKVETALPDGRTAPATITSVQTETGTDDAGKDLPARAVIEFEKPSDVAGVGPAAVRVTVTTDRAEDALVVPVTALLGLAEGGYGIEVVTGTGATRVVAVTVGLVADARAAVTGGGLAEGDRVVIPRA